MFSRVVFKAPVYPVIHGFMFHSRHKRTQ